MNNISREMILEQALKDCLKDHVGVNDTDLRVWWKFYMDNYEPFDLKDVDVRPLPSRKYNDESVMVGSLEMDIGYILGWNTCIEEIEKR